MGDERLVDQLRGGNQAAFEAIYERYHRPLLGYCRHMVGSASEAEDAIQQVFASAYGALRGPAREIELRPWLYAIARNTCISSLRRRPAEWPDAAAPTRSSGHEVEQRAEIRALVGDIASLPEDQRSALVLSELADLAHDEIATVVGCERTKVKSLVHQARQRLLECRKARDTSCAEVRDTLSTLRGGSLRRAWLQLHLRGCAGCREYRGEIQRRRALIALTIPVPSAGLRESILAATSGGGTVGGGAAGTSGLAAGSGAPSAAGATGAATAASGATAGGGAAGTGILSALAAPAAAKAAVGLALAGGATAGGLAIHRDHLGPDPRDQRVQATPPATEDGRSPSGDADGRGQAEPGAYGDGPLTETTEDTERATSTEGAELPTSDPAGHDDEVTTAEEEREPAAERERARTEESSAASRRDEPSRGNSSGSDETSLTEGTEIKAKSVVPRPPSRQRGKLEKAAGEPPADSLEAP